MELFEDFLLILGWAFFRALIILLVAWAILWLLHVLLKTRMPWAFMHRASIWFVMLWIFLAVLRFAQINLWSPCHPDDMPAKGDPCIYAGTCPASECRR